MRERAEEAEKASRVAGGRRLTGEFRPSGADLIAAVGRDSLCRAVERVRIRALCYITLTMELAQSAPWVARRFGKELFKPLDRRGHFDS